MQRIIDYFVEKYQAHTIIVYGSYASDLQNEYSDVDLCIITDQKGHTYDNSKIGEYLLDAFIYSTDEYEKLDITEFIQLYDGFSLLDERGIAFELIDQVNEYIANHSITPSAEKDHYKRWISKMLERSKNDDTQSLYRRNWLMTDSLELYSRLRDEYYLGPKKTMISLEEDDIKGYELFERALRTNTIEDVREWIYHVMRYTLV